MGGFASRLALMFPRKQRDAFGRESPTVSVRADLDTYHEEGWLYDLGQVQAPAIALGVAAAGFLSTYVLSVTRYTVTTNKPGCVALGGTAACSNGLDTLGFLLSTATILGAIVAIVAALYSLSESTHRVRKIAQAYAVLGAVTLISFTIFIIALST